jgi:hypothetical protein
MGFLSKDVIGIIVRYIRQFQLTMINIEYHAIFIFVSMDNIHIYNQVSGKSYNYRNLNIGKYKYIGSKYMRYIYELPKNYC